MKLVTVRKMSDDDDKSNDDNCNDKGNHYHFLLSNAFYRFYGQFFSFFKLFIITDPPPGQMYGFQGFQQQFQQQSILQVQQAQARHIQIQRDFQIEQELIEQQKAQIQQQIRQLKQQIENRKAAAKKAQKKLIEINNIK